MTRPATTGRAALVAAVAVAVAVAVVTASVWAQPRNPGGRDLAVERVAGRCGENALSVARRPPPTVTARPTRRGVVVQVRNYVFNCGQILGFAARLTDHAIVLTPRAVSGPAARCTCFHEARLLLRGLEPGDYEVKVDTGDERTVLGPGGRGLVSERIYATGRVTVR